MQKLLTLTFCTATCLFFSIKSSYSQCSGLPCLGGVIPQADPTLSCSLSNANQFNCYSGSTTSEPAVVFPSWCGDNVNTQWFAFTADTSTERIYIFVQPCSQGSALQGAIFSSNDCANFSLISNCVTVTGPGANWITANGMVPGQVYYLCIGGDNGAICDFSFNVTGWAGYGENCVFESICCLDYSTLALDAVWSLDPPTAGILDPPTGPHTNITWLEPGTVNLCVNAPNCPESCSPVEIRGGEFDEYVDLCEGKSVECHGHTYSAPGVYNISEPDGEFCVKTTNCHVHLIPTAHTADTVYMCQNGSVTCAGEQFIAPGSYPVKLIGPNGCDSIVTCKVNIFPPSPTTNLTINLCGPAEYGICANLFNSSGIYTESCTNWLGCDSVIHLDLAILEPQAVIDTTGGLSCQNDTITLNGSHSSLNTALNGFTVYNWFGPGIIGSSNSPTVQVNQVGTYCLELTHRRGSLICRDTACVQVTSSTAVPSLPQISGNTNPCQDSSYVYAVVATGSPAPTSFTWTLPGNLSFTTLSPDSILVTWDTVVSGPICVTANNSCGASQPACQLIAVQMPIQTPGMSGPGSVCAGGGNYMFTLNVEQPGVLYNWTIPTGAVLTGSGDTVNINFLNSVSGQVCVTPQNTCGIAAAVCQNVQVNPIPSADLSSDAQICAGEFVNLNFALNGNGPFDLSWSINNQIFTLNDIPNGHILSVNPTQTTVYKITSIRDNSATACTALVSDSVTVTVLTIDTTVLNFNTCDPALAGSNTQVLTQLNGCDSLVITLTTLQPSDTTMIFDNSCDVNMVGVFTQNLSNIYGCDSLVVTTVVFSLADTTLVAAATCDPAAVGVFNQNLLAFDGCDSLVITTVSLLPTNTTMLSGTTCNPVKVGGVTSVLSNQFGCDSTVITTISLAPLPTTFLTNVSCDPAATGVFTKHFTTAGGCDSVVVTTISLLPSSTTILTGTSCNPDNVGVFTTVLPNHFDCDSTVISTVTLAPLPTTFLSDVSCDPAATGVFTKHFTTVGGCDSVVVTTVSLLPSSATMLTGTSCKPAQVGVFTTVLANYLGCDSTVITTVSLLPSSSSSLATTTCDPALAGVFVYPLINQFGCDSIVTETRTLLPGSMTNLNLTTCDPAQVGSTTNILPNQFGCDSTIVTLTSLLPANNCSVAATLLGSDIPCTSNTGTLTLTPTVGIAPFSYTVLQGLTIVTSGTITTLGTPQLINGLPAGNYTVNISSPNGFSTSAQATVVQLVPPALTIQANSNYTGFDVSCTGATDGSALAMLSGGAAPYTFSWSNGGSGQQINNLAAGVYSVTVFDAHGCTNVSSVALTEPAPLEMSFIVNDPDCFNEHDGAIQVQTSGGASPYRYSLNNDPDQTEHIFTGLNSGVYSLKVSDANDCQKTEAIVVNPVTAINVDLGNDINIGQGDHATLQATVNVPSDSLLSVVWSALPFDSLDCVPPICLTQTVTPLISTVYTIQVQSLNGCTGQDHVKVIVDRRRQIYVPNVFTPNDDGANDLFTIYASPGSVRKILSLQVFDRWGEALIALKDFLPNNPTIGWDGSYKGEPMNPGVFVWVAEIEFIDGKREVFQGDVTVVR